MSDYKKSSKSKDAKRREGKEREEEVLGLGRSGLQIKKFASSQHFHTDPSSSKNAGKKSTPNYPPPYSPSSRVNTTIDDITKHLRGLSLKKDTTFDTDSIASSIKSSSSIRNYSKKPSRWPKRGEGLGGYSISRTSSIDNISYLRRGKGQDDIETSSVCSSSEFSSHYNKSRNRYTQEDSPSSNKFSKNFSSSNAPPPHLLGGAIPKHLVRGSNYDKVFPPRHNQRPRECGSSSLSYSDLQFKSVEPVDNTTDDIRSSIRQRDINTRDVSGSQSDEKLSIMYFKRLISEKEERYFIKNLLSCQIPFKNLFSSKMNYEFLPLVFQFVEKLCSINYEQTKKSFLSLILESNEFYSSLNLFLDKIVDKSKTDIELKQNMSLINEFIEDIIQYLPTEKLNNYYSFITKACQICDEMDYDPLKVKFTVYQELISDKMTSQENELFTYKTLNVFPKLEELFSESCMDIKNVVKGPYASVPHYIDVQFKLMKEDFLIGLRNGLKQYLSDLENNKKSFNHDIFVYPEIYYDGFSQDDNPMIDVLHIFSLSGRGLGKVNWSKSKRLIHGSLLLFSKDNFKTVFFGILNDRKTSEGNFILSVAFVGKTPKLKKSTKFVMIESRVFFEPYRQVCTTLRDLDPQTFPMRKYIVFADVTPQPPKYLKNMTKCMISGYDVSLLDRNSWPDPEKLQLNSSQIEALQAALTREFILIQGPPGTGKTYLGIKIISILLDNKHLWSDTKSPIFVACFRNGAVDQMLDCFASENKSVVRLGGRSSSEVLKDCTLKNTVGHKRDPLMQVELLELKKELSNIKHKIIEFEKCKTFVLDKKGILQHIVFKEILTPAQRIFFSSSCAFENWLLDQFNDELSEEHEKLIDTLFEKVNKKEKVLSTDHPFILKSLKELATELNNLDFDINSLLRESDGGEMPHNISKLIVKYYNLFTILRKIIYGLHLKIDEKKDISKLLSVTDLESLSNDERWTLYHHWSMEFIRTCEMKVDLLLEDHDVKLADFLFKRDLNDGENLRAANVDIVGATTTGAARLNKLLTALKPKIVIIEEAAEVLESHAIASLTQHVEHLIMIGDHKQLRPSPASHISCVKYQMDVSLFERMIGNSMDCFTLSVQHRMRPEISALVSPYIYKDLTNHPSVEQYPDVKGMRKNLFFLNHNISEDILIDNDSHRNSYEATLALEIASYLMKQGYESSQITVLTVYIEQLLYMEHKLRQKYPLLKNVLFQVVDNYQGEENDIIILSLVRSNSPTIGFLSHENRVCVALSRAKQGFLIVGNMETLQRNAQVWKEMNRVLVENSSIDDYLALKCVTHGKITQVKSPSDFEPLTHGGCTQACGIVLDCGHICSHLCHPSDIDHKQIFICDKPCERMRNCGLHNCSAACGEECPACDVRCPEVLPCGHTGYRLCGTDQLTCETPCLQSLDCGHVCPKLCHFLSQDINHSKMVCESVCGKVIESCPFGHRCEKLCSEACGEVCLYNSSTTLDCGHVVSGPCAEVAELDCEVMVPKDLLCGHTAQAPCSTPFTEISCEEEKRVTLECGHEMVTKCGLDPKDLKCLVRLDRPLPCGHSKETFCHQSLDEVLCEVTVPRNLDCGHTLQDAKCSTPIQDLVCQEKVSGSLPCGHESTVACGDPAPRCTAEVPVAQTCGHTKKLLCHQAKEHRATSIEGPKDCRAPCDTPLPCGHTCLGTCGGCMQGRVHIACNAICGKPFICGHKCATKCWKDFHVCEKKCLNSCKHKKCSRECGEICEKCMLPCEWSCEHYKCSKKCWESCDRAQCSFPCKIELSCGHPCSGLCGEPCPPCCLLCSPPNQDLQLTQRLVLLEDCGHVLTASALSELLNSSVGLPRCSDCLTPILRPNFVRCYPSKKFYLSYARLKDITARIYNNKNFIIQDFTRNFKELSKVLNCSYKSCDFLNRLLHTLNKRTLPIIKRRSNENKLGLKTLLFICYYVIDIVKMVADLPPNQDDPLNKLFFLKIDHIASYLFERVKNTRISPSEMMAFSKELSRLKCLFDFVSLKKDKDTSGLHQSATELWDTNLKLTLSLNEFTMETQNKLVNSLRLLQRALSCDHELVSSENDNKISEFFKKYYSISYHMEKWFKCANGHGYYSFDGEPKVCPVCAKQKKNALFLD